MSKAITLFCLFSFLLLNIIGCAPLIVGAAVGALGGYAVSKDTIQGETDKEFDTLWSSALTVARIRGTIKQEDYSAGYIEVDAKPDRVWIKLIRLTQATTRLRVSARKYHLPDLNLAQNLFVKIMDEAK